MVPSEIGFGNAVLSAVGETEFLFEDVDAVGAGDAVEAVEEDFEVWVLGDEGFDEGEVEDGF